MALISHAKQKFSRLMPYVQFDSAASEWMGNNTDSANIGVTNQWSLLAIFNPGSIVLEQYIFDIREGTGDENQISLGIVIPTSGSNTFNVILRDSAGTVYKLLEYGSFFTSGVDHDYHVVVTYDGAAANDPVIVYRNGVAVASTGGTDNTGTQTNTAREVTIGDNQSRIHEFVGRVYQIALWSTVLSAANALTLYEQRWFIDPTTIGSGTCVHWWRPGYDTTDIGKDYGLGTAISLNNGANITSADCFTALLE